MKEKFFSICVKIGMSNENLKPKKNQDLLQILLLSLGSFILQTFLPRFAKI
jgi:hypothetical protein